MAFPTIATICSDIHYHTQAQAAKAAGDHPGWGRDYQSADRRVAEIVAAANSASSDLLVDCGDKVDGGCADVSKLSKLTGYLDYLDTYLVCDFETVLGNHIWTTGTPSWSGAPSMSDYFDALDAATCVGTRTNYYGPDSEAWAFEYTDDNGMVWIFLTFTESNFFENDDPYDYLTWLNTRLQAHVSTDTPCCIVSHAKLWQNANNPFPGSGMGVSDAGWANLQTIYDNATTLQLVAGGHAHAGGAMMKRNGVWFIDPCGSISMPLSQTATGNSYLVVEINPQQVATQYGNKAQIKITQHGYGSYGKPNYDKFGAFV